MERHVSIYKCVRRVTSGTCVFFELNERMTEKLTASAPFTFSTRVVYLTIEPPVTVQLSLCSAVS